eukprot:1161803-Pelagomonas_calceolata.AAC.6
MHSDVQAAAPSAAASSPPAPGLSSAASGLQGLADFIASNYEGMGKNAADVLPVAWSPLKKPVSHV